MRHVLFSATQVGWPVHSSRLTDLIPPPSLESSPTPFNPTPPPTATMSYFSNILTATKTRYASLRQGDEADGDTEDDSHITRVLRNYYAEQIPQGRPYPTWLPPPPNARSNSPATSLRNTYGRRQAGPAAAGNHQSGTSLSDIWDAPADPQQRPSIGRNTSAASTASRPQLFPDEPGAPASGGGGLTAQQRIKERLWGSRGAASSPSPPPQQQYAPPPARVDMPMGPPQRNAGQQPYMGSGMPWDDGHGGGYEPPAANYGGGAGNMRRGAGRPGLPTGPRDGRPPYR
jgi:hypothetical protein